MQVASHQQCKWYILDKWKMLNIYKPFTTVCVWLFDFRCYWFLSEVWKMFCNLIADCSFSSPRPLSSSHVSTWTSRRSPRPLGAGEPWDALGGVGGALSCNEDINTNGTWRRLFALCWDCSADFEFEAGRGGKQQRWVMGLPRRTRERSLSATTTRFDRVGCWFDAAPNLCAAV